MSSSHHRRPALQLEMLETRTLLAGDLAAIQSSGAFVTNFDPAAPGPELSIATAVGGQLTIDASLLPDVVKDLKISGFESVTIVGADSFEALDLSHIGKFSGAAIDVTGDLTVHNVVSVELHSVAGIAWFFGTETRLDVDDSRSATIVSNLDKLTVSSKNDLNLLSTNPDQKIVVEFDTVRPSLMFPSENVKFTDTGNPTTPTTPTTPGTDNPDVEDDSPASYNVIIISLSNATMTEALQSALKRGDANAVKHAFVELKNVQLAESVHSMAFALHNQAEISLAQFRTVDAEHSLDPVATARVVSPVLSQAPALEGFGGSTFKFNEAGMLPDAISNGSDDTRVFGALQTLEELAIRADATAARDVSETQPRRGDGSLSLESIRSSLSGLVSGAARFSTVSAYIINDVGTKLEPGVLPGLLVDARSSRVRRESVEWIEL